MHVMNLLLFHPPSQTTGKKKENKSGGPSLDTKTSKRKRTSSPTTPPPPPPPPADPKNDLVNEVVPVGPIIHQLIDKFESLSSWRLLPVKPTDITMAILTTTSALPTRLPVLYHSWISQAPFPVMVVTDNSTTEATSGLPPTTIKYVDCPGGVEGFACKTARALEALHLTYGSAKWYIVLSDTSLVIPSNLIHHLRSHDPTKPM